MNNLSENESSVFVKIDKIQNTSLFEKIIELFSCVLGFCFLFLLVIFGILIHAIIYTLCIPMIIIFIKPKWRKKIIAKKDWFEKMSHTSTHSLNKFNPEKSIKSLVLLIYHVYIWYIIMTQSLFNNIRKYKINRWKLLKSKGYLIDLNKQDN